MELEECSSRQRRIGPKLRATRKCWQKHICRISHVTFRKMYRVEIMSFKIIMAEVRSGIETVYVEMENRSSGSEVCAEVRLEMTLRNAAGGIVWDIHTFFGISTAEFYRSV